MARAIPEAVLKNVDKLEPLPVTAQALMKAISDGDASFAKLAGLIELDQAVAANVLRISRSAAYAGQPSDHRARRAGAARHGDAARPGARRVHEEAARRGADVRAQRG